MKAFASFHPVVLLAYFIAVLSVAMFADHPVLLGEALVAGICFNAMIAKKGTLLSDLGFYFFLFLVIVITNPLFSHNGATPLFFLNGNAVTLEALLSGLSIAVLLVGVLFWFKCYSHVMTSDKFFYLFGKPIPRLSLILSMVLRFVPLFKIQMKRVRNAQKTLGMYSSDRYTDKIRASMGVFSVMITWALENAVETGDSMKARGYGLKGKSHYSLFRFTRQDGILLAGIGILLGVLLAVLASGRLAFSFYPRVQSMQFGLMPGIAFASFGILVFLPFIIEIKERIKWNYFVSKI